MKWGSWIFLGLFVFCNGASTRENRQFGFFNWLNSEPEENVLPLNGGRRVAGPPQPEQHANTPTLQRRTSQLPPGNHHPRRITNTRKNPATTFRRPVGPPPGFSNRLQDKSPKQPKRPDQILAKRKLLLPIISSSYTSTNIQGQGHPSHLKDILHSNEQIPPAIAVLEEQIIHELNNSVESEEIIAEVTEIKAPQEDKLEELIEIEDIVVEENSNEIISTTTRPATTTTTLTTTTQTKTETETETSAIITTLEIKEAPEIITEIEVEDYEERSPYLPTIADDLQDHILIVVEQPNLQTITIPREDIAIDQANENTIADTNKPSSNAKESQGGKKKSQEKYLAGYQEIYPANPGNLRGERPHENLSPDQFHEDRPAQLPPRKDKPSKVDFYPLGKPTVRPTTRKPLKIKPTPKKPPKPENTGGSFFDFLPFIGTSAPTPSTPRPRQKPRRPLSPNAAPQPFSDYPAGLTPPVLVKVGDSHPSETAPPGTLHVPEPAPIRSFFAERPPQDIPQRPTITDNQISSARIDEQFYAEIPDIQKVGEEPYIVLPSTKKQQFQTRPGPYNKKYQTKNNLPPTKQRVQPAQPNRRPGPPIPANPLPMTSQPIIGLPHGPPSRKQTPFQVKKPLFPPQLPSYQAHSVHPQPPNRPLARPRPQQNALSRFQQQPRPNQNLNVRSNQHVRPNKPINQKIRPNQLVNQQPRPNQQSRPNQLINQQGRLKQPPRPNPQARPIQPLNNNVRPNKPINRPRAPVQTIGRPLPKILAKQGPIPGTIGKQHETKVTEQNSQLENIQSAKTAQKQNSELKSESYLQDSNPFSLKPSLDKSSQPSPLTAENAITSHLSSLLNTYLFSSTSTQAPPTLPRRVFDVVNDYSPPDSLKSTQITTNKAELSTSTQPPTTTSTKTTPSSTTSTTTQTSTTTAITFLNQGFQILYEDNTYKDNTIETGDEPLTTTIFSTDKPTSRIAEHVKVQRKDIDAAIDVMSAPKPAHQHIQITDIQLTPTELLSTTPPTRPTQVFTEALSSTTITTEIPVTVPTTNTPYTSTPQPITTHISGKKTHSPLQNIINEYKDRVHPEMSEQFSDTVINTITKNFEHKKNIFEQFVSNSNYETLDQPFIPNTQVFNSDWSLSNPFNFEKRKIENQPVKSQQIGETDTTTFRAKPTAKGHREYETGFKPMNKPMEQPLFTR